MFVVTMNNNIKLDKTDLKILKELDFDARASFSNIGKKLNISKHTIAYRVNNLQKKGIIRGFYAVVDMTALNYLYIRVFIKLRNMTKEVEKEVIEYLKKTRSIAWIALEMGFDDIGFVVLASNVNQFEKTMTAINENYSHYFDMTYVSIATRIWHFPYLFLFNKSSNNELLFGSKKSNHKLDEIDSKILTIVSKDGRATVVEIAKKLNTTARIVQYRIKQLCKEKIIIGFRADIATQLLGYNYYKVFFRIQNLNKELFKKFISYCKHHPNIIYVTKTISDYEIEIEVQAENNMKFNTIVKDIRHEFNEFITDYTFTEVYDNIAINYLPSLYAARSVSSMLSKEIN